MLSLAEVQRRRAEIDAKRERQNGCGTLTIPLTDPLAADLAVLYADVLATIEQGWEGHVSKLARAALRPPRGK